MSKFRGKVGFVKEEETVPGVWKPTITERYYRGDVTRFDRRWESPNEVNDHLTLSEEINLVADSYLTKNLSYMCYVEYLGVKWKIKSITPAYPRIRLTLGGEYNERTVDQHDEETTTP